MKTDTISIEYTRYYDKNDNPTCAINFQDGRFCAHYATTRFGLDETCLFAGTNTHGRPETLRRRGDEGSLIPGEWCPLWKKDKKGEIR